MNIDKEKVRELAIELYKCSVTIENNERLITEWLEQNQPEPIVVGLSDEQVEMLSRYVMKRSVTKSVKEVITEYLKTQTFAQPSEAFTAAMEEVSIRDEEIERLKTELEQLKSSQLKPNWDDAPDWANWLAQDKNGVWTWFENKPLVELVHGKFVSNYPVARFGKASDVKSWQQTLEQRPTPPAPQVEVGQVWSYDNKKYYVDSVGKLKSNDELWIDCVTYRSLIDGHFYTRTLEDFLAKFERVERCHQNSNY